MSLRLDWLFTPRKEKCSLWQRNMMLQHISYNIYNEWTRLKLRPGDRAGFSTELSQYFWNVTNSNRVSRPPSSRNKKLGKTLLGIESIPWKGHYCSHPGFKNDGFFPYTLFWDQICNYMKAVALWECRPQSRWNNSWICTSRPYRFVMVFLWIFLQVCASSMMCYMCKVYIYCLCYMLLHVVFCCHVCESFVIQIVESNTNWPQGQLKRDIKFS